MQEAGPWEHREDFDGWRDDGTCTFCGSLRPGMALERVAAGDVVCPTDKAYKMYVGQGDAHSKVYFQHFSADDRARLISLVNGGEVNFDVPGHFYVLPFFMGRD